MPSNNTITPNISFANPLVITKEVTVQRPDSPDNYGTINNNNKDPTKGNGMVDFNNHVVHFKSKQDETGSNKIPENLLLILEEGSKSVDLGKNLTLFHTVTLAVGQIIGSGIFISPNVIVKSAGSVGLSLIIWTVGGLLTTCGALCFGELGALYPKSGGEYQYLRLAYGKLAGFCDLWVLLIVNSMATALISLTFASYTISLFLDDTAPQLELIKRIVAAAAILFIIGICIYGTKVGIWVQSTFTILKILALMFLVSLACVYIAQGKVENLSEGFSGTNLDVSDWSNALLSSMWAYNGWSCINYIASEVEEPKKNLPRALVITGLSVTCIYVVVNVAYHTILSTDDLKHSQSVAVVVGERFFAEYGPNAVKFGRYFFAVSVAVSTFGSLLSVVLSVSRLPYAGAAEGMLPECFGLVSKRNKTPIISLILLAFTSIVCIWPSNIGALMSYSMYLAWLFWGLCFAAVIVLRWKSPDVPRPFKVPLIVPVIAICTSLFLVIGPFCRDPISSGCWILVVLASVPVYYGYVDDEGKCAIWMKVLTNVLSKYLKADIQK